MCNLFIAGRVAVWIGRSQHRILIVSGYSYDEENNEDLKDDENDKNEDYNDDKNDKN